MTILIAPDKFKGSLTAKEVCDAICEGLNSIGSWNLVALPLADGGEGTCELLTSYSGGSMVSVRVLDPLFREIDSGYGISRDGEFAFLEMAKASGLQLLKKEERNPLYTSTVGTGDLIRHALDHGVKKIILGIGGSATNDGGMGMAEALGVVFYGASGERLKPIGKNLKRIHSIDTSKVHPKLQRAEFTIFCDVDNPLHGPRGAAFVFAPQKGASEEAVKELDEGLQHYEKKLESAWDTKVNFPGAGAGGGLPASIKAMANVVVRPGMEFIAEFTNLEDQVRQADVIITGEGTIDSQTLSGKVVKGVADMAAKHRKPVIVISGKCELNEEKVQSLGLKKIITLVDGEISEKEAIENAFFLIKRKIQLSFSDLDGIKKP